MENGKKMELDTVLSGDEVFVWKGDTINPEKDIIHRKMKDGDEEDPIIDLNFGDGEHFPPMPPMPPMPPLRHMRMTRANHSHGVIDLNDPNIIYFRKKKISGNREKIEIIRNKSEEPEDLNFNFQTDEALDVPEPPLPPDLNFDNKIEKPVKKEIRKEIRIEQKKDQKTEEEAAPKETK